MSTQDIRWIQRSKNYEKAFSQLQEAVEISQKRSLSKLEEQGLIQAFEYTYELAWNTLKDYFESQGEINIHGSKDAIKLAFRRGLIENGDTWMNMVEDRTMTTHTYNDETAKKILQAILKSYYFEFQKLCNILQNLKEKV